MNKTTATICFLVRQNQGVMEVALPIKKLKIGSGLRNGYGGRVEQGETSEQCAIREMSEEAKIGVLPSNLDKRLHIDFYKGSEVLLACDVFLVTGWIGEPEETEEMGPVEWFSTDTDKIPLHEMMAGDQKWVPYLFSGQPFNAELVYSDNMKEVVSFKMIFAEA